MNDTRVRRIGRGLVVLVVALATQGVAGIADESVTPLPGAVCATLQGLTIPSASIGLPTGGAVVESAALVSASTAGNANGDFCRVTGIVKPEHPSSPNLEFEVNLPLAWNRRMLQMGGGGYDGSLVTGLTGFTLQPTGVENPLKQGFVTLGTDGGHQGGAGFDGRFGMDDEALANYGKESVKKGHDVAMAIVTKAYGRRPIASTSSADRRAATRRSMQPRATRTTTMAWSRTIRPTTSPCCTSVRSTWAGPSMRAEARRG